MNTNNEIILDDDETQKINEGEVQSTNRENLNTDDTKVEVENEEKLESKEHEITETEENTNLDEVEENDADGKKTQPKENKNYEVQEASERSEMEGEAQVENTNVDEKDIKEINDTNIEIEKVIEEDETEGPAQESIEVENNVNLEKTEEKDEIDENLKETDAIEEGEYQEAEGEVKENTDINLEIDENLKETDDNEEGEEKENTEIDENLKETDANEEGEYQETEGEEKENTDNNLESEIKLIETEGDIKEDENKDAKSDYDEGKDENEIENNIQEDNNQDENKTSSVETKRNEQSNLSNENEVNKAYFTTPFVDGESNEVDLQIDSEKKLSQNISNATVQKEYKRLPHLPEDKNTVSTLTPVYCFGFNRFVPIINLSDDNKCFIFYSCSHLGVILDYVHEEQLILQGHCNQISTITASNDKRWLATGDQGENSVVIVWDSQTAMPVRSMFEPHPNGVVAIALSPDARYLATLSAEEIQTFAIWDWTNGEDIPLCSASLSVKYGLQNRISFCEDDVTNVSTNSETQVLFYQWDKVGNMKYFAPVLTDDDFKKPVGKFCSTVFLSKTTKAITGTSQGLLVVWDGNNSVVKEYIYDKLADLNLARYRIPSENTPDKKPIKLVPVHQKPITAMTIIDDYIVTGDAGGAVKFFDYQFKLMFWYKDWNFGAITSISSSNCDSIMRKDMSDKIKQNYLETSDYPTDATIDGNRFVIRDFIVGTDSTILATVRVEGSKVKIIFRDHDSSVFTAHAHPTMPLLATGSYSGLILIWNYITKQAIRSKLFERQPIKSLCFDHRGIQLAVGFANGTLRILDTHVLKDVTEPFNYSKTHIEKIQFSEQSDYLATVSGNNTTALYRAGRNVNEDSWIYVARHRAHYKKIVELIFGKYFDTSTPRLFTLGEDRRLVEYDLYNASEDYLPILQEFRIEQSAIPLSMCWYPSNSGEGFFVIANDEYKLKLFNHQTKMCRYTFLGPTYGSPVKKLLVLPNNSDHPKNENGEPQNYLVYANKGKIGLIRLPLDGNPYNYMTMIAHPKGVSDIAVSQDGRYVFSVGVNFNITIWKINVNILEARAKSITDPMSPYYELIEGGEFGQFMHELKNYFYYSMIRMQGIDSLDTRKVDVVIQISEVPYIMRAIGFYPSEEEIENMMNELKFGKYYSSGNCETHVNLDTFLKLYVNHRPPFGIGTDKIIEAFRVIEKVHNGPISMSNFMDLMLTKGEPIQEDELIEYLATLMGYNQIGGSLEQVDSLTKKKARNVKQNLPDLVDAQTYIEKMLHMTVVDKGLQNAGYRRLIDKLEPVETNANSSQTS